MGEGDRQYHNVPVALVYNFSIPLISDYFTVQCKSEIKRYFYPKLSYASIHYNPTIRERLANVKQEEDDDFNILVLGLDSISRLQFQRMLPQTFDYITKELNGIVLKGLLINLNLKREGSYH
jgi:hypothetical protein